MCEKYGVNLHFDTEAKTELIQKEQPDVLIIATGAKHLIPSIPGINNPAIKLANNVLMGEPVAGNVLIVGGGMIGSETAEYCTDYCDKVTIVEMTSDIAAEMYMTVRDSLLLRFKKEEIVIHTNTKVLEFKENSIICKKDGETISLGDFDSIILAMGSKSYNPFEKETHLPEETYIIGDAKNARSAIEAIYEAARVALKI